MLWTQFRDKNKQTQAETVTKFSGKIKKHFLDIRALLYINKVFIKKNAPKQDGLKMKKSLFFVSCSVRSTLKLGGKYQNLPGRKEKNLKNAHFVTMSFLQSTKTLEDQSFYKKMIKSTPF